MKSNKYNVKIFAKIIAEISKMTHQVSLKRTAEEAFQSPPLSPRKRNRMEDVAAPRIAAAASFDESPSDLPTRDIQTLSQGLDDSDIPTETTPPRSPKSPTDSSPFEEVETIQEVAPSPRESAVIPVRTKHPPQPSLITHLMRRELGMSHPLHNPEYWYKKAEKAFELEKNDEALRLINIALESCPQEQTPVHYFVLKGDILDEMGDYSLSAKIRITIASQWSSYEAEGYLRAFLCCARMGQWQRSLGFIFEFRETWNNWFSIQPSKCPLSEKIYLHHWNLFRDMIDELQDLLSRADEEGRYPLNMAVLVLSNILDLDESRNLEILYRYNPILALEMDMQRAIKKGNEVEKEDLMRWLENNLEIEQTIEGRRIEVRLLIPKLLFNQGLQTGQKRQLELALNYFNRILQSAPDPESRYYLMNHLFFCNLALEQLDTAFEIATTIEELAPGTARVQLRLCSLARGEPLTQDQIEDFHLAIGEKQSTICDPVLLRFIIDRLFKGPGSYQINQLAIRLEKWARSFIVPRSFHPISF